MFIISVASSILLNTESAKTLTFVVTFLLVIYFDLWKVLPYL